MREEVQLPDIEVVSEEGDSIYQVDCIRFFHEAVCQSMDKFSV